MTVSQSLLGLHLQYRLWIAQMNFYINSFRIFNDYISNLELKDKTGGHREKFKTFRQQFIDLRSEIDDLTNQMHLIKMKLAAFDRDHEPFSQEHFEEDDHASLQRRCGEVVQKFEAMRAGLLALAE